MSDNKHTPEPWHMRLSDNATPHIEYGDCHLDEVGELKNRICTMPAEIMQSFNSFANARRIVACVNACAGLETEMLTALVMDGTTLQNIMRRGLICLEQRDELLKALEDIAWTRGLNERPSKLVEKLERKAMAAIASVKEQP